MLDAKLPAKHIGKKSSAWLCSLEYANK